MQEEWAEIDYFPNYKISTHGRVWNVKRDRILSPSLVNGYLRVILSNQGRPQSWFVHRLVAETFLGFRHALVVNHIDGDKENNCLDNLEWVTQKQNMRHAHDTGLMKGIPSIRVRLVEWDETFRSLAECARAINGTPGPISHCLQGLRPSYLGYTFERA